LYAAVEASGEDVAEQGEIQYFVHSLRGIAAQAQQVKVGERYHDVIRLPPDPAAHVNVAVSCTRTRGVDGEANAGETSTAVAAAATSDVEGDGYDVALFDVEYVAADFNDFAGDFMAEDKARRSGGAASNHVLIAAAYVGSKRFDNNAVICFATAGFDQLGVGDGGDFHFPR